MLDSVAELFGLGIAAEAETPTVNLEVSDIKAAGTALPAAKDKIPAKIRNNRQLSKLPVIKKVGAVKWEKCDTLG